MSFNNPSKYYNIRLYRDIIIKQLFSFHCEDAGQLSWLKYTVSMTFLPQKRYDEQFQLLEIYYISQELTEEPVLKQFVTLGAFSRFMMMI